MGWKLFGESIIISRHLWLQKVFLQFLQNFSKAWIICHENFFVKIQENYNKKTCFFFKKKFNLLYWENAEIHSTAFFSKKTKITLLQGLSSSAFYMLYIFVVSTAWVKYKNKSWKVSLGYLLFHITTGVIFQMPTLFCFSLGDKDQLFWEDHKISQLPFNCFDKSADLLSKCQNKWKINP